MPYKEPWKHKEARRIAQQKRRNTPKGRANLARWKRDRYHRDEEYRSKMIKLSKASYERNKERVSIKETKRRLKYRSTVLQHYGGKCVHCGCSDPDVLEMDHIHNNGSEHRKMMASGGKGCGRNMYTWLIQNSFPSGIVQILCSNCNTKKRKLGGVLPAQEVKTYTLAEYAALAV